MKKHKMLLLALLLYDLLAIALAARLSNFDYEDMDANKRHAYDERRSWRRKALMKPQEDHKEWEDRRRHEYDGPAPRYDDVDRTLAQDQRAHDPFGPGLQTNYKHHFDDPADKVGPPPGSTRDEMHPLYNMDKESEKKLAMNCDRPRERYEACFAGCAEVTCDNPRDSLRPCYPFCEQGCVCIPPYVRDDRTHKCVVLEECTRGLKGIPDLGDEV